MEKLEKPKRNWKMFAGAIALMVFVVAIGGYVAYNAGFNHAINTYDYLGFGGGEETFNVRGFFTLWVDRGSDGTVDWVYYAENTITNAGRNAIRHYFGEDGWVNSNATTHAWQYIAIGTGNGGGASSTNLTTLFDRQVGTDAYPTAYNVTITYTWTAGSFDGDTIQEMGLFNADDGTAKLFNYHDFTGITLQSTDSLQVQSEIQFGT